MTSDILAFWAPGPLELLIVLIIFGIPVALIVLVVVYVLKGSKQREKLHQQIGDLSDELKRTQEQLQSQKKDESSV
jgi:type II secretory pathway pseudopilin PulG